jgi:hypothetical protein
MTHFVGKSFASVASSDAAGIAIACVNTDEDLAGSSWGQFDELLYTVIDR